MSKNLLIAGTIQGVSTLKDSTIKFSVYCNEMSNDQAAKLIGFSNKFAKILISDENISQEKMDLVSGEKITHHETKKSQSKRIRNTLYVWWENSKTDMDFEQFYNYWTEKFIDMIKAKLD